ncbi:uncharacterized protein LOC120640520 [Panicum virgatum]|uniref:GTD-binding domain-containing protein n=1 Tax=Panicum virgatum TaxID=38727 RepID=A0A8T0QLB4_PANVG|nr:uncharacterized protein LOC120640520 [Panicum virgatum]KAG2571174.1 hypothetical protein PVAP13_7KG019200 [Panicum virgatum]KAG2571175.1 hypothetical protein PVAP13_7KG019200 [Panicum virgatum]
MTAPCPGAAALRGRWAARSLAGAFLDLALAWACLCLAALLAAAARVLALPGLPLPCTCARPHLPCLLAFLARYPPRALASVHAALRARFPFATGPADDAKEEEPARLAADAESADPGAPREEARAELQRELEKERSAAASGAEEAMAMMLRLQKEKSALEIEARQQRRTADERCAFYEDEVEELRDIVLVRDREARALRKEVDAYRHLLGLGPAEEEEEEDDDQEMVTPHSMLMSEGEPSSSRSVDATRMQRLGNDSGFSFKTPFFREQPVPRPVIGDRGNGGSEDNVAVQTPAKAHGTQSRLELSSTEDEDGAETEDDGAETVEILPLSARSQDLDQPGDFQADGMESTKEQTAHQFQEVACAGIDKIDRDHTGSENDASVYDVHVVDDICFSTEVKGLIGRSFSDATMQAEKLQTRVAADDLLGKSLNAIKGAQDKIRHAASERRQSLQLQLLEDIANQLQGIKDAAEAGRHMYCATPKSSKKS